MMSAPYLKLIMEGFLQEGDDMSYPALLNTEDEILTEKAGPPPNPDAVMRDLYRERLEAEGFDWTKKPEIEGPDLSFAKERELPINPIDVELLRTRRASELTETPSE